MKITVITIARNERILMPFFLRHYEAIADEIIVYDDASTDSTADIVRSSRITRLIPLQTFGEIRESSLLTLKNQIYRVLPGEWFIIVDTDEFVWHRNGIRQYLEACEGGGCTLPQVGGFDMIGSEIPVDDGKTQLVDIRRSGIENHLYGKRVLIHRDVDINFHPGCHYCYPTGRCTTRPQIEVKLLHYKWLSERYVLERAVDYSERMSADNMLKGWWKINFKEIKAYHKASLAKARDVLTSD